jgi:hypothetical protein
VFLSCFFQKSNYAETNANYFTNFALRMDVPVHQHDEAVNQVLDVLEAPRLRAVAIDRDGLVAERLDDKVADHPPVVGVHARPKRIEDARNADLGEVR